jgi:WhiB family redox-sensing transcriptional regulator
VSMLGERPDWYEHAACRGKPLTLFFPPRGVAPVAYKEARAICARCPVRQRCLDFQLAYEDGMAQKSKCGMFGGLTPEERDRLGRTSTCQVCGETVAFMKHKKVCATCRADSVVLLRRKLAA